MSTCLYKLRFDRDPNVEVELDSQTEYEAAIEALDTLGWSLVSVQDEKELEDICQKESGGMSTRPVYIVLQGENGEGSDVVFVGDTREEAQTYVDQHPLQQGCDYYDIQEWAEAERK